ADWFVRESRRDPPGRGDFTPDLILVLHVLVNATAIGTLLYGVASGRLPRWRVGDATLSTGLNSGISRTVGPHELTHPPPRPPPARRRAGRGDRQPVDGQLRPFLRRAPQGAPPPGRDAQRPVDGPPGRDDLSLPAPLPARAIRQRPADRGGPPGEARPRPVRP